MTSPCTKDPECTQIFSKRITLTLLVYKRCLLSWRFFDVAFGSVIRTMDLLFWYSHPGRCRFHRRQMTRVQQYPVQMHLLRFVCRLITGDPCQFLTIFCRHCSTRAWWTNSTPTNGDFCQCRRQSISTSNKSISSILGGGGGGVDFRSQCSANSVKNFQEQIRRTFRNSKEFFKTSGSRKLWGSEGWRGPKSRVWRAGDPQFRVFVFPLLSKISFHSWLSGGLLFLLPLWRPTWNPGSKLRCRMTFRV